MVTAAQRPATNQSTARERNPQRASDLHTKLDTLRAFLRQGSARIILAAISVVVVARVVVGTWGWADLAALMITGTLVGFVEWFIHLFLLHAPAESFRMRVLQTGTGHREHHLDPDHVGWLLLSTTDAAVFVVMIGGFTAAWTLPLLLMTGTPASGPLLTALLLAYLALGHYEWTHLLVHTRHRPTSRYYKRLARNHRLHHFRNEHYWLGVTSNLGDRVLRTYPADKSDVPLSDTARTLAG